MKVSHLFASRLGFGLAIAVGSMLLLTGCGQKKAAEPSLPPSSRAQNAYQLPPPSPASEGPSSLLEAGSREDRPLSAGDAAWHELQKAMRPPPYPEDWQTSQPSKEEIAKFEQKNAELARKVAVIAGDFYARFPDHENAAEARRQEYSLLNVAAQLGDTNGLARLQTLEQARLKDPNLTEDERLEIRMGQLQRDAMDRKEGNMAASLAVMEKGARGLQKEFPKRPEVSALLLSVAQGWLDNNEPDKSRILAEEIAADDSGDQKEAAEGLLKKIGRLGKSLELKFKAVDGREVDLQKLKGKVVLVDFWATWCRPCMAELPKVKAAYDKLHPQGFDILGISFDQEQSALEKVLAREKLAWPQYFEAGGEENQFGKQFDIAGIPTLWLVDKKGVLRELNARENLVQKVEKLLAEK